MISFIERAEAVLLGFAASLCVHLIPGRIASSAYSNLMMSGATFSSIAIGFLATVLSIIVAISGNPTIQAIFHIDKDNRSIVRYMASVMRWGIVLLITSGIGLAYFSTWWLVVWCFFAGGTLGAFERAIRIMIAIVRRAVYG